MQNFIRNLTKTPTIAQKLLVQPVRSFNKSIRPPQVSNFGSYLMVGAAGAGMAYLAYSSIDLNRNKNVYSLKGETFMSPIVQQRVAKTLGYFGYGLAATGGIVFALRNSMRAANAPWYLLLACAVGCSIGTHSVDYNQNWGLKMLFYTGFIGSLSLSILPLIQMSSAALIADACLATGCSMAALSTVAYMAPSEQYLMWGGALSLACGGMFAVSMLGIFYPQSNALWNIWLYGGLALSGALTLYRMQRLVNDAKTQYQFDPINHSIGIYSDSINMFIRFLLIL